jgi:hypothetical protein
MSKRILYIIIGLLVLCLAVIAIVLATRSGSVDIVVPPTPTPTSTVSPTISATPAPSIPSAPVNLSATPQSSSIVMLNWLDNSTDEDGFIIYRDAVEITRAGPNASSFQDTGLKSATTYQYSVKAYNEMGESGAATYTIKTLNPAVTVRLDRIGVYNNGESGLRGSDGEVYLHIVVSDGKNPTLNLRLPQDEIPEYKLADNETREIGKILFAADDIGNRLTLTIWGYEKDGDGFEPLVYDAIEAVVKLQAGGMTGLLLKSFNINLDDLLGQLMGEADDYLGSYEMMWDSSSNWGAGQYSDIVCFDKNGVQCLRLWFTITAE